MKKILLVAIALLVGSVAHAQYLGTDDQPVSNVAGTALNVVSTQTFNVSITEPLLVGTTGFAVEISTPLPAGTNSIGTVGLDAGANSIGTVGLDAGTNQIGFVSGSTVNINGLVDVSGSTLGANDGVDIGDVTINNAGGASAVNIQDGGNSISIDNGGASLGVNIDSQSGSLQVTSTDTLSHTTDSVEIGDGTDTLAIDTNGNIGSVITDAGGEAATVTSGRLDVNATITSADVSESTVGIRGSSGQIIGSEDVNGKHSLNVRDEGIPSLAGLSFTYVSSNTMVTSGVLTLTGTGKKAVLLAKNGSCTFTVSSGDTIEVFKNNSETVDLFNVATNPTVTLDSKDAAATCRARIYGAS